ncbi:MAG: transposase [candidate division FCPU426 bacterium]
MDRDSSRCHRRSIRLKGYDYSRPGAYFVTACTLNRALYFDDNAIRQIAERCWLEMPQHFPTVVLDTWVLMPNHLHGIVWLGESRCAQLNAPTTTGGIIPPLRNTLSVIIRTYKAAVTSLCRRAGRNEFYWQRNYYEHIIRDHGELDRIRQYINDNPAGWDADLENPKNIRTL